METERKLSGVPEPAEHAPRRTWSSKSHQEIATGQPNQWWWHPVTDFIAGSIAGFAGKIVEYPADTVKVRMQAAGLHKTTYSGPLDCATRLIRSKGVSALYTGLPVPLLGTMVETAMLFTVMGQLKPLIAADPANPTLGDIILAGAGAGIGVSFVLTPVELIKIRMQTGQYQSSISCITDSVRKEGLGVLFKGWTGTVMREIPGSAAWFGCYEAFVRWQTPVGEEPTPGTIILGGGVGGMGYWTAFYPADSVKTELQASSSSAKDGFWGTFARIFKEGGIRTLYRGLTPTLARAIPANAAVFYVYELLSTSMGSAGSS